MFCFFVHQANNAYIFPGFGLGLIMSGTIRVHDDLLLAACKFTTDLNINFNTMFGTGENVSTGVV